MNLRGNHDKLFRETCITIVSWEPWNYISSEIRTKKVQNKHELFLTKEQNDGYEMRILKLQTLIQAIEFGLIKGLKYLFNMTKQFLKMTRAYYNKVYARSSGVVSNDYCVNIAK